MRLRQMQDTLPDVLLVDIEMPRMDGYALNAHRAPPMRKRRSIPILMIHVAHGAAKHRSLAFEGWASMSIWAAVPGRRAAAN